MALIGGAFAPAHARLDTHGAVERLRHLDGGQEPALEAVDGARGLAGAGAWMAAGAGLLALIEGEPEVTDAGLRALAEARGPAVMLLEAWRRQGFDCLQALRGSFALAVLDSASRRALLAVDRLGIRPLAYREAPAGGALCFGSRLDLTAAVAGVRPDIDPQGVFAYLYAHMVPSPGCFYTGFRKLLPAQCLRIEGNRSRLDFYWEVPYHERTQVSVAGLAAELDGRLETATRRALGTSGGGTYLSGGLDSSTVTGMAARLRPGQVDAYGIGFSAEGYDEMAFARASARHFGVRLHEYYVSPADVVATVPRVAEWYDEPFGNASAIPAYHCARFAREDGRQVLLAGDGGDEIFGGNARYAKQKVFGIYQHVPAPLRTLLETALEHLPGRERIAPLRKAHSYVEQARIPLPDRLESYNFLHRSPLGDIFEADFLAAIDEGEPLRQAREAYTRAASGQPLKRMLHLDLKQTLADNDLRKVVKTAEAAGVQVRFPMIDQELVEFAAGVPAHWLLRRTELRWFYRKALDGFLAPETLNKSKHGFGLPFGVWMQTDAALHQLAGDALVGLRRRGWLKSSYIDLLLARHGSEHADYYGVMIWVLMMLELWLAQHGH